MQIIAPLGLVIWGLEVLQFAGRFGATRVLKQEGRECGNTDLGLCSRLAKYFLITAYKTRSSSLFWQAVQLLLIYSCKRCERKIGSKIEVTA